MIAKNLVEELTKSLEKMARLKMTKELTDMYPVAEFILKEDSIFVMILLAALNPDITVPGDIYDRMVARGYTPKNKRESVEESLTSAKRIMDEILNKAKE